MLRGVFLTLTFLVFLGLGASAPFVMTLGYVWIDCANPQYMSYGSGPLAHVPISLIMGAAAFGSYIMMDRRQPPRFNAVTGLSIAFALWCTVTTFTLAELPDAAYTKWNVAVKTVLFSAFIPHAIRSRVQIEAFLQVFIFSTAVYIVPAGIKTLLTGGGYGHALTIIGGNSGLAEGSTLATVCLMLIPIILCFAEDSLVVPNRRLRRVGYSGLAMLALAAAVGTFERTAVVGMAVMGGFMWLKSRHKFAFGAVALVLGIAVVTLTSPAWDARIATISDYSNDESAYGRILVWIWTLHYVASHPLGGGFNLYMIDHIFFPDGTEIIGKAFHSIYFEVLGEQGIPGLMIFGAIVACSYLMLRSVERRTRRNADLRWAHDLGAALQASLVTYLACGAFIGIGFQPYLYYAFASSVCLREYVRRSELASSQGTPGSGPWQRPVGTDIERPVMAAQSVPGWRRPS